MYVLIHSGAKYVFLYADIFKKKRKVKIDSCSNVLFYCNKKMIRPYVDKKLFKRDSCLFFR